MTSIGNFLTSSFAEAIGWTVVHSLWQATVLVLLFYLIVSAGKQIKTGKKYFIAYMVLMSQFLLSIVTLFVLYEPLKQAVKSNLVEEVISSVGVFAVVLPSQNIFEQLQVFILPYLPIIVSIWITGMLFFFIRLLLGYSFWYRLRKTNVLAVPDAWQELFQKIKSRMNVRNRVSISISTVIMSPMLIGHLKPVILMPFSLVNQLTIEQVETILAHELAHIRRFDFVLNIIQLFIESIFYYHPAIWWLGQQIRTLREECADDIALKYTNSSIVYARTLLTVAEQSRSRQSTLAISLLGQKKQHLLTRVQRILQQPVKQPNMREKLALTSLLLCLAIAISLGAVWSPTVDNWHHENNVQYTIDTLPMGQIKMEVDDNGETLRVRLNDGKIEELNINGREIPPTEFSVHEDKITQLLEDVPPPPPPPPHAPSVFPPPPPPPPAPNVNTRTTMRRTHSWEEDGEVMKVTIEEEVDGDMKRIWIGEEEDIEERSERLAERAARMEGRKAEMAERHIEMAERQEEIAIRQEEMIIRKAEMAERQVEMAERIAEQEAKMVERKIEIEERMVEQKARFEEQMDLVAEQHSNKSQWLEQELLHDGLINDVENYIVKLNNRRLKVNGNTVSDALHEKYMDLYEFHQGTNFSKGTSVNVAKKMF